MKRVERWLLKNVSYMSRETAEDWLKENGFKFLAKRIISDTLTYFYIKEADGNFYLAKMDGWWENWRPIIFQLTKHEYDKITSALQKEE